MKFMKRFLNTLFIMMLLSGCFTATVFATDTTNGEQTILIDTEVQQTEIQNTSEATVNNTDLPKDEITSAGYAADTNAADVADNTVLPAEDAGADNPELVLGVDYYIDEQGQIYYLEPEAEDDELVIDDIEASDSEDQEEEKEPAIEKPSYSEKELRLLASLIYAEAGNQSYNGMLAVANVVLNRLKSKAYSHVDSIKEVIYDHKWAVQFSVTIKSKKTGLSMLDKALERYDSGKFTGGNPEAEKKAMQKAIKAAKSALEGTNNIGSYLCFHTKRYASRIKRKYSDYKVIGDHIFFRTK